MRITTFLVLISVGKLNKTPREIYHWELPILEAKFPGGLVTVVGEGACERSELPDAEFEFSRLEAMYGDSASSGTTILERAFGPGEYGRKEFAKTLKAAPAKAKASASSKAKKDKDGDAGKDDDGKEGEGAGNDPLK